MYIHTRVGKKPENLIPGLTRILDPPSGIDPKKPGHNKGLTRPDPDPNFGFRVFSGIDPKNPKFYQH